MTKFKLDPNPTFTVPVEIPVHGGTAHPVKFTFKHRTREEMKSLFDDAVKKNDVETVLELVAGWELDDELNEENVRRLVENYQGAGHAIVRAYLAEIQQVRLGN